MNVNVSNVDYPAGLPEECEQGPSAPLERSFEVLFLLDPPGANVETGLHAWLLEAPQITFYGVAAGRGSVLIGALVESMADIHTLSCEIIRRGEIRRPTRRLGVIGELWFDDAHTWSFLKLYTGIPLQRPGGGTGG